MSPAQDKTFKNCIGMEFVLIPAGKFTSNWKAKNEFGQDVPQQRVVTISKPFYLGKYAVTQEQWAAAKRSRQPVSSPPPGIGCPVNFLRKFDRFKYP